MGKSKVKFAAIYNPYSNSKIDFNSVALVTYNNEDDFEIRSGLYRGKTNDDFNILEVSEKTILDSTNKVFDSDVNNNKMNIIIFDDDYLKEKYQIKRKEFHEKHQFMENSLYKVEYFYQDICLALMNIEIKEQKKGNFITKQKRRNKTDYVCMSEIREMLKQEYPIDTADDLYKKVIEYSDDSLEKTKAEIKEMYNNNVNNIYKEDIIKDDKYTKEGYYPFGLVSLGPLGNLLFGDYSLESEADKNNTSEENNDEIKTDKNIDVNEIYDRINSKIVGQEEAIKTLIYNIYHNQKLIDSLEDEDYDPAFLDSAKVSILLDGETGTGKTAIEKEIAKELDLPIVITNANKFSQTGFVGPTITDILKSLINKANGDIKKAERGIVVLDEIDKIRTEDHYGSKDMNEAVQNELLTFIGGGEYDIKVNSNPLYPSKVTFDTSKLTFILSGAFTDLREEKIKEAESKYNAMGFKASRPTNEEKSYVILPEDYIKSGLKREFFGRIKVLAGTKSYDKEDFKKILIESVISPLKNLDKSVKIYGYPGIKYSEELLDALAAEAVELKTGARGLQTIVSGIQNKLLGGLINNEFKKNRKIEITTDLLQEYKKINTRKY